MPVKLNGKPDVASETQDRMLSAMEDLGNTVNLAGLIMPAVAYPFVVEVMQGVNRAIAKIAFYPLVYATEDVRSGSADADPGGMLHRRSASIITNPVLVI